MASQTLIWDEEGNRFETFVSLFPEMMVTLGTTLCSFKDGILWTHDDYDHYNNFFGVHYPYSNITPVFNKNEVSVKTFETIEQLASQAWGCPEIVTSSNSYRKVKQISSLIASDFDELEGKYNTAFYCDANSIGGLIDGGTLKGNLMSVKLQATIPEPPNNLLVSLVLIQIYSIDSPLNVHK